jgi:hypothetical protein
MHAIRFRTTRSARARRGAALVYATALALVIAGMSVALLGINVSTQRARTETQNSQRSFYAAEAGLSDAFMLLDEGRITVTATTPYYLGSSAAPVALGPSNYWAEVRRVNSRSYSIVSTGVDGRNQDRLELILAEEASGFFQYAAFGADGVRVGANAFIDSYDSAAGGYDAQVTAGNAWALEHGNVGSNGDIVLMANTAIHGDAIPGPGHVVDDSASNTYVSGSTDPADEPFPMPPIDVPVVPSLGALTVNSNRTLGPGPIHYSSILGSGGATLTIVGPAQLVVDNLRMRSNTNLVFDCTAGNVEVYGTGNFVLESNSTVTTVSDSALGVTLLLSGDNTSPGARDNVSISANSDFIGAIYAPKVSFRLASNFNVYGSIICKYLDLAAYSEIHFDEALLYDGWGSTDEYAPALWRRLPRL